MTDDFDKNRYQYLETTSRLNDFNEIYNVNKRLGNATTAEHEMQSSLNRQVKTQLLTMKQKYITNDSSISRYQWRRNTLILMFWVICIAFIIVYQYLSDHINKTVFIILLSVLLGLYLAYLLFDLISQRKRRINAFNQFYWDKKIPSTQPN